MGVCTQVECCTLTVGICTYSRNKKMGDSAKCMGEICYESVMPQLVQEYTELCGCLMLCRFFLSPVVHGMTCLPMYIRIMHVCEWIVCCCLYRYKEEGQCQCAR